MIFDVLTLFPGMFEAPLGESIFGKAVAAGLVTVRLHNIRDFALDKHKMADDRPFGGGEGMVMKPEPVIRAVEHVAPLGPPARVILLTPQGRVLDQHVVRELSEYSRLMLICGRYEGVDERVSDHFVDDEISLGDFVLTGGELAAMAVMDAVARLVPGVLGNSASPYAESFASGDGGAVLEGPQYTRPREFRGMKAPDILFSGDHGAIRRWRRGQALLRTMRRRPDLFARLDLGEEDQALLREAQREESALQAAG